MADNQNYKIVKGFNTNAGLTVYDYDSLANKPNIEGMIQNALEESIPPVDNTLTNEGQSADAKVTGEAISRLDSKIGSDSVPQQIEQSEQKVSQQIEQSEQRVSQKIEQTEQRFSQQIEQTGNALSELNEKIGSDPVQEQINQSEQRITQSIEEAISAIPPNETLTFQGAVQATYNGSAPIEVAIPIVDNSLKFEGNAADAKATGEAIGALQEKMNNEVGQATKTYVDNIFGDIEGFVAQSEPPEQHNFLWVDTDDDSINEIENIDLSNYYTKAEIDYKFEQLINQYLKS